MTETLYERLGGSEKITRIANDIVDNHAANPRIGTRFTKADLPALKKAAAEFIITGTGGPEVYTGKDMATAHAGMNINEAEMIAVMGDVMDALDKNGIGQREKEEVLFVLFSLKDEVLFG
jgi:hemoglobin